LRHERVCAGGRVQNKHDDVRNISVDIISSTDAYNDTNREQFIYYRLYFTNEKRLKNARRYYVFSRRIQVVLFNLFFFLT